MCALTNSLTHLYLVIPLINITRRERLVSICRTPELKISSSIVVRDALNLFRVSKYPDGLHTHDHMLQNVTMNQPNTRVHDAQAPASPSGISACCGGCFVAVQVCGIPENRVVIFELEFVGCGIICAVTRADVVVVLSMGMERVVVHPAVGLYQASSVDVDDLENLQLSKLAQASMRILHPFNAHLANLSRPCGRDIIPASILKCCLVVGYGCLSIFIDVHKVWNIIWQRVSCVVP